MLLDHLLFEQNEKTDHKLKVHSGKMLDYTLALVRFYICCITYSGERMGI